MEKNRRKELQQQWKNRHPEMGVLLICCKAEDAAFLGISKDIPADINSNRFKLQIKGHPNKRLQALWDQYGEENFTFSAVRVLKYDDPQEDQTNKLTELLEECRLTMPRAEQIWK